MPNMIRLWVNDRPGVLDRITGLIRRHGINIKTLTTGDNLEGVSQMTISLGEHLNLPLILDRIAEMTSVQRCEKCTPETHIIREMLMARISGEQSDLLTGEMRIIKKEGDWTFVEYVAEPPAVDRMIKNFRARGVTCVRTGALALPLAEGDD